MSLKWRWLLLRAAFGPKNMLTRRWARNVTRTAQAASDAHSPARVFANAEGLEVGMVWARTIAKNFPPGDRGLIR